MTRRLPEVPADAHHALWHAVARHGDHVAVLLHEGSVWWAAVPPGEPPWRRAVFELVQGVYRLLGRQAHRVLRRRIYTPMSEHPLDRAVVQVAARRLTTGVEAIPGAAPWRRIDVTPAARAMRRTWARALGPGGPVVVEDQALLAHAMSAAGDCRRDGPRWARDRMVGASLAREGRLLATARNRNGVYRCEHAEVRLLLGWAEQHGALGEGWRLGVSLQCCRMCAALVTSMAEGPVDVVYARPDPGRLAQGTMLAQRGWERQVAWQDRGR